MKKIMNILNINWRLVLLVLFVFAVSMQVLGINSEALAGCIYVYIPGMGWVKICS